ncbi:hypothetical protein [Streptomyces sp. HPF1205]|uniref:hypothetical protein n=1 Tax=Streptomyces sp. HPF1205 TaxID=2873262 RepID=UPI001CEC86B9|nr:hypothetical protein [Streptomyces sp. HPF1205]
MVTEVPSPRDPHVRHMRRIFLAVVTGSFLFLIPWIGYLSASLPDHHEVDQWRLAWVGFDGALIVVIGVTALCAWKRLQIFIPWAMISATLLCCDAWFDIILDWNTGELTGAILTAAFAELPLALLLFYAARKMIRLTVLIAWQQAGRGAPVPPLSRLSMGVLTSEDEFDAEWPRQAGEHDKGYGGPDAPRPSARPGPNAPDGTHARDAARHAPDGARHESSGARHESNGTRRDPGDRTGGRGPHDSRNGERR